MAEMAERVERVEEKREHILFICYRWEEVIVRIQARDNNTMVR
jgi:hypothetical protein